MKKNAEWLKIFDTFYVINASSDIVCSDLAKDDDDVASKESVGNFWTN